MLVDSVVLIFVLSFCICTIYFFAHAIYSTKVDINSAFTVSNVWSGHWYAYINPNKEQVDTTQIGIYQPEVVVLGFLPYTSTVEVCDTEAPVVQPRKRTVYFGETCNIMDFIYSCEDASAVTYEYQKDPNFDIVGPQNLVILVTDSAGNTTKVSTRLTILNAYYKYYTELGEPLPEAKDFLVKKLYDAEYTTFPELEEDEILPIGEYPINVRSNGKLYHSTMIVQDTISPEVITKRLDAFVDHPLEADSFIDEIVDASPTTVEYITEPDWSKRGYQKFNLLVVDEAGNETSTSAGVNLDYDRVAPVIRVKDFSVTVGNTVSYRKSLDVTDNCDAPEDISLEIDSKEVDLSKVGKYQAHCIATDTSGNVTEEDIVVRVVSKNVVVYDQATIYAAADKVLASIIKPGMSDYDKCVAIYNWTHSHIAYGTHTDKSNWLKAAYMGLVQHRGDCFAYAATSRALLDRAGIRNMIISKEVTPLTSASDHYWNLVDYGAGYFHFDATPRKDGTWFCLWTDAQLEAYSSTHSGSHNFTRSRYPGIN